MSPRLSCEAAVTACRWAGVGALWAWFSGLWGHLASHSRVRPAEGATTLVPSSLSPSPARATCACPGPQCMSASCPPRVAPTMARAFLPAERPLRGCVLREEGGAASTGFLGPHAASAHETWVGTVGRRGQPRVGAGSCGGGAGQAASRVCSRIRKSGFQSEIS